MIIGGCKKVSRENENLISFRKKHCFTVFFADGFRKSSFKIHLQKKLNSSLFNVAGECRFLDSGTT